MLNLETDIVKIGNVELTEKEAFELYQGGKYIVTFSKIYQLHYSVAQQRVYGTVIYTYNTKANGGMGLTRRGRHYRMSAETVNHILGFQLVKE